MLDIEQLAVGYYHDLMVLRDVSMRVEEGTITTVLGANGVGKSTLLKAIFGFLPVQKGTIAWDGTSLLQRDPHRMVDLGIVYISQQPSIFGDLTVEENLRLGAWSFRQDRSLVDERVAEGFARFPALQEKRRDKARSMSGGQQRMLEIARALMVHPKLLLVDEPTAGLSLMFASSVYEELARLRDDGMTILLVDQEIRRALKIADYVYVIELGTNRYDGKAADFANVEKTFWL